MKNFLGNLLKKFLWSTLNIFVIQGMNNSTALIYKAAYPKREKELLPSPLFAHVLLFAGA